MWVCVGSCCALFVRELCLSLSFQKHTHDSGMCKVSFAGDDAPHSVPFSHDAKTFAKDVFIDQERNFRHRLNHKPCRLEDGRGQFYDSFSTC